MRTSTTIGIGVGLGIGAAAALGFTVGGFFYASRWPASQIFGRTLIAPRLPGELALTFDDGPNPACTPRLLDVLARHSVRATFFLIGDFAQQEPALARSIAEAGHTIGNHSWSHPNLSLVSSRRIREELARTKYTLEQVTGSPVRLFRPPFGARRPYVLQTARELGMTPVMWNAMTSDWSELSPDLIAAKLMNKIGINHRAGFASNIVLHDGGHQALNTDRGPSIGAAERLLACYAPRQKFVTLDVWPD